MKKLSVIIFFLFTTTGFIYSQNNLNIISDNKLLAHYTQAEIDQLLITSPSVIEYENFIVNNSFFIEDIDNQEKTSSCNQLQFFDSFSKEIINKSITSADLNDFNIYNYNFKISETRNYYIIGDTGKLLVVYSKSEIITKYNESRGF